MRASVSFQQSGVKADLICFLPKGFPVGLTQGAKSWLTEIKIFGRSPENKKSYFSFNPINPGSDNLLTHFPDYFAQQLHVHLPAFHCFFIRC